MILNPKERTLRVSNAGHNPVLYYDGRARTVERVNPRGIALGFDRGPLFESNLEEITLTLNPSDRILAYTDGVVEALNAEGGEFGEKKLVEAILSGPEADSKGLIQNILGAVKAHRGETEQSDDITMTTFRLEGTSTGGSGSA
jgi:sigma-B regulation protein RsbU (phosphoserine phosphatase)